jgi:polar amino acid transport system substrate-binding protein
MKIGSPLLIARIAITILFCIWDCGLPAAAEPVRIAYPQVFPPFTEFKDGKSEGLAVDIVRAAAAQVAIDVEFVPVPFEQVQGTLEDGRADAIFPLTITPERLPLFDFSDPFLVTGGALFVRAPNASPENLCALSGKIVVTPRTGPLAAFIQKNAPDVKLAITTDYEESLARLVRGEADAAALGFHVAISIANRLYPGQVTQPRTMFTDLPFAVAVIKGRGAPFLTRLNAGIAAIRADGRWQKINDSWSAK